MKNTQYWEYPKMSSNNSAFALRMARERYSFKDARQHFLANARGPVTYVTWRWNAIPKVGSYRPSVMVPWNLRFVTWGGPHA